MRFHRLQLKDPGKGPRLHPIIEFPHRVKENLPGLLGSPSLKISNGALQGMNKQIQWVSHRSFGFRKPEYSIPAIYQGGACFPLSMSSSSGLLIGKESIKGIQ